MNKIFAFFIITGVAATITSCASIPEPIEIEKSAPSETTTLPPVSSTLITTITTTTTPTVFVVPSEGEGLEAVVDLCDLASNSLQCEQECFSNDSTLSECIAEAEEITGTSILENNPTSNSNDDPPTSSTSSGSSTTSSNQPENPELEENTQNVDTVKSGGTSEFLTSYTFSDPRFGTLVTVTVNGPVRSITSNALPNHITGDFPNSGNPNTISKQDLRYEYPTEPTYIGSAANVRTTGVAINGVKFEPGTAETVTCESGEVYRVEALQQTYNLGIDLNNAHVQPTGEYHYHGVSQLLIDAFSSETDLVHVGFAADGFLIYYSKSALHESGYELASTPRTGTNCLASGPTGGNQVSINGSIPDGTYTSDWLHIKADAKLDPCNGITLNGNYQYLMTDTFPYIGRCLNGQISDSETVGGTPPNASPSGSLPAGPPPPDLNFVAQALGVEVGDLMNALGPPPPDLESAANTLGVSLEELRALMGRPG